MKNLKAPRRARGKGFTLSELLIVIAIIAILAIIIIVAINPGAMIAKSRDSQRFSDVTSLATAVNLFLADSQTISNGGPFKSTDGLTDNDRKKNDGTGWIKDLDFRVVTSGAPIASLPIDPTNDGALHYVFGANTIAKTYEIDSKFENSENKQKQLSDGGNSNTGEGIYEVGTDLTILGDGDY